MSEFEEMFKLQADELRGDTLAAEDLERLEMLECAYRYGGQAREQRELQRFLDDKKHKSKHELL